MSRNGCYEISEELWNEFKTNYGFMFNMWTRKIYKLEKVQIYVWYRNDGVSKDYYEFVWWGDGIGCSRDNGFGQCLYEFLVEKNRLYPHRYY